MWYPGGVIVNGSPLGGGGGGGGGGSVAWGDITGKPTRLGAFTASDETKLDGIEALAEVNPKHEVKFAAISADTDDNIGDGEIGFYNGNTQVQSGGMSQATRMDIPDAAAAFGVDPSQPSADLDAVNTAVLFDDILSNGGQVTLAIVKQGTSKMVYVQAETIAAKTGGYSLTNLTFFNDDTIAGTNDRWNIVSAISHGFNLAKDIVDLSAKLNAYVLKTDLAGHEQDRYASYNNAFVQNSYRRGNIVLTTDTSGTPTEANQVRQPDIATGTGMLLVSTFLRTDADPNELAWASESGVSDYSTGDVFYLSLDRDKGSYLKVELTSNGTLVGSGDGAYIYALATFTEVGNVANVQTAGDYFKISEVIPSDLQIEIPYTDILGAPWVLTDGSNVTQALKDKIQGDNESVTLTPDFRVNATNVDYYVSWADTNTPKIATVRLPSSQADTQTDTDLKRLLHPASWLRVGDWVGAVTTNATRAIIGTSLTFTFNYQTLSGTIPTGNDTYKITVVGEDVHRGELRDGAFREEPMDLLGDADQQAFSSSSWTSYSDIEFDDDDLIGLCLSPTENGYGDFLCIRFGDVGTTGGQIHTSGFSGRRNGSNYQVQRTSGSATLYVRIFVIGNNSS